MTHLHRLTAKSIFLDKQTALLLAVFVILRIFSFLLFGHTILQAILMFAILMAFGVIYFKSVNMAWMIVLGEFFLGGAGHFLEFFGLSLRSVLVFTFISLWILHHASVKSLRHMLHIRHKAFYLFIPLAIFITLAIIIGVINNHQFINIVRDAIPFSFFIFLFPFYHYFQKQQTQEYMIRLLLVFILGSALFSLITFITYSGGFGVLQDTFYHWFRDVAMGKITNMGTGFFRIVTPEHLLVVPAILLTSSLLMRDEAHHKLWRFFLFLCLIILVLNLSRTYLLALGIGMLFLKYKHSWKRWFIISSTTLLFTLLIFISTSLLASGGKTIGLELFGVRFGSILEPESEPSTYTRMSLLSPIFDQIGDHPLAGSGLGATVSFYDPVRLQNIKTPQFDWGYLELYTELGLFGFVSFMAIIAMIIFELVMKIESLTNYHDFYVGVLGGTIALIVMTITSPALFHVLGIFYLVIVLTLAMKPIHIFDKILTHLYRVFHRIKD